MKLRLATYNIHKGLTGISGRPRIHDVRLALHSIDADIVFLQEVQDRNERVAARHPSYPRGTQLEYLATSGYQYSCYGKNAVYSHGHHGNAILSRHPIGHFTNHDVSDHALERRGMLHAVAHVQNRDVHLLCVHFGLIKRSRIRQAQFLIDFVQREIPVDAPLIIGGDFNDWHRRVDPLLRDQLGVIEVSDREASAAPISLLDRLRALRSGTPQPQRVARTFPAILPALTLDRLYLRGVNVSSMEVPKGLAWAKRSDHAPLIAEVELR